ncbi:hypothetical protein RISK_003246 [Rhodopirellula islandica]|uniref:Uncharacterized protein n=1 Tax=Rhodopirellula islandica TaxID=595434 RepID=A0A0J1EGF4_RHOIS|nr:hypothetical protein RISK_003246 [Rhodopirellula islandica]
MLPLINRHPLPAETESGGGASKTVCSQAEPGNQETGKKTVNHSTDFPR